MNLSTSFQPGLVVNKAPMVSRVIGLASSIADAILARIARERLDECQRDFFYPAKSAAPARNGFRDYFAKSSRIFTSLMELDIEKR